MGIYVWGTGCGAAELMEQGLRKESVTASLDSFPSGKDFLGKPVLLPEEIPVSDCELLIVTTRQRGREKPCRQPTKILPSGRFWQSCPIRRKPS